MYKMEYRPLAYAGARIKAPGKAKRLRDQCSAKLSLHLDEHVQTRWMLF